MRIKWPNDVYAGGLKLGGVLCHSAYRARRFATVTGVGLNLANREPTTCVDALITARHSELALPGAPAAVPREARSVAILGAHLCLQGPLLVFCFAALDLSANQPDFVYAASCWADAAWRPRACAMRGMPLTLSGPFRLLNIH